MIFIGPSCEKGGAEQPEYHVNDYLCSVRVVTDAYGEVLEHNDYSGFGFRLACSTGNVRGAIEDGVGIAVDAVAAAVPFVPGGVGAVRAGAKAANAIDNAVDATKAARTADGINNVVNSSGTVSATTRGRMNEERVLNDFGLTKNTKTVQGKTKTGEARNTIPDAITSDTIYEVKDVQKLSNTKQIQAQIEYAKKNGLNYKIITGADTHVSGNIPNEYIIRLNYLGPQQ